jgi:hypothetical protein
LQQAESAPMGQAFMVAARSKAVSTPSFGCFVAANDAPPSDVDPESGISAA